MRFAALAVLWTGCSFVGVRGPGPMPDPLPDPRTIHCNDSGVLPAIDALGGAAALAVTGGGIILEHTSDNGEPKHFTLYYAAPLLAVAIIYFSSASFGTNRISRCSDLKDARTTIIPVMPIDPGPPKPKPADSQIEIDTSP